MLRINGGASREYKYEVEKNADCFLIALEESMQKMNSLNLENLLVPGIGKRINISVK